MRRPNPVGDLQAPPLPHHFGQFAPAELYRFQLPARKATPLVRICRTFDPERLRRLPPDAAAARLERERGIGPYSIGFIWTDGLGRFDRGIVGDLGLLKVCSAIEGPGPMNRGVEIDGRVADSPDSLILEQVRSGSRCGWRCSRSCSSRGRRSRWSHELFAGTATTTASC